MSMLSLDALLKHRRHLHRNPELSHREYDTADYVEQQLRALEPDLLFRPAATSVAAFFRGRSERAIAFRADLDALPLAESSTAPYRSQRDGVMHACGHDGHTAILLGVAGIVADHYRSRMPAASTLLIFQQAEESVPAGAPLVREGLGEIRPTLVVGFHLWPDLETGSIGVRQGCLMAGVDGVSFEFRSRGQSETHGVSIDEGSGDALSAAVRLFHGLRPLQHRRRVSDDTPASLHLGRLAAGAAPHRLAKSATLRGTLRYTSLAARDSAIAEIASLVSAVESEEGVSIRLTHTKNIRPVLVNGAAPLRMVVSAASSLKLKALDYPDRPLGVSEDFGWYLEDADGAFFLLGCTAAGSTKRQLHTPSFDFDERALFVGGEMIVQMWRVWQEREASHTASGKVVG